MFFTAPLSVDTLNKWREDFFSCPKNILAQNVCSRIDPFEACLSRTVMDSTQHVFNHKVIFNYFNLIMVYSSEQE